MLLGDAPGSGDHATPTAVDRGEGQGWRLAYFLGCFVGVLGDLLWYFSGVSKVFWLFFNIFSGRDVLRCFGEFGDFERVKGRSCRECFFVSRGVQCTDSRRRS